MKIEALTALVAVADSRSFSEAARRLNMSKSVVSERVAELERSLGTRLLQRTTRRVTPTDDGQAFLLRARRIVHEVSEAAAELSQRRGSLGGPLRLSAPVSFGTLHLGPALYAFLATHRDLELSLELDDRFVDPVAGGYDAIVRHGAPIDRRVIVKRLARSRRALVAAPAYLAREGRPAGVDDLGSHRGILYTNRENDWSFVTRGRMRAVRPRHSLRVNNGLVMRDAAIAGLGIALLPTFIASDALARGALEVVDVHAAAEDADVQLAYPAEGAHSAKLTALAEFLRNAFGHPAYWDRGDHKSRP